MKTVGIAAAVAAAVALSAGAAAAQSIKDFPEVSDQSFVTTSGRKVLKISLVVPATRKDVWQRFTTAEGYMAWATPVSHVDGKTGGIIEDSYDASAKVGDENNIRNQILSFTPERTLAIQNVHAPRELPGAAEFGDIITIIELEDAGPKATRVTLTAAGYKPGEPYDTLYKHFSWGNAYSLMELKASFVKGPIDWKARAAQEQAKAAAAKVQGTK